MKQKKCQERLVGEGAWSDRAIGMLEAHTGSVRACHKGEDTAFLRNGSTRTSE